MILNLNISYNGDILRSLEVDTSKINTKVLKEKASNRYLVNRYEVNISDDIKDFCWDFCSKIIKSKNQFDRLTPYWANDEQLKELIRIQRSYAGKIAEVAFLIFLAQQGITTNYDDMFEIYEGQRNTDSYDFITLENNTVDIKAAFRPDHKMLVVNCQQLNRIPKDYYVGVKLNASDRDKENKIIDDASITKAKIYGYAECNYLNNLGTGSLGEAPCKQVLLKNLMGIDRLIKEFYPKNIWG